MSMITGKLRLRGIVLFAVIGAVLAGGTAAATMADEKEVPTARDIKKLVKQAVLAGDDAQLLEVLKNVGRLDGRDPTNAVLGFAAALPPEEEHYYWLLLDGVASFQRPDCFSAMGDYIVRNQKKPIARDLLHALAPNRSKYMNRVIRRVLERGPEDLKLMALDRAQHIHVRRTVDVIMPFLVMEDRKQRDKKSDTPTTFKAHILMALAALTHKNFGDSLPNWQSWWTANRHKGLKVLREEAENERPTTSLPIDPIRAAQFFDVEKMPSGKVLVIKGARARNGVDTNFDHIENILARFNVKHDVVQKERLEEKGFSLKRYAAVFINCTQINTFCQSPGHQGGEAVGNRLRRCLGPAPHDEFNGKMKPEGVEKIKKFVQRGGFLFTEDWVLMEVLEPAFPKFIGGGTSLTGSNVRIRPAKGQTSHKLLRGVFVPPVDLQSFRWDEDEDDEEDEDEKEYDPSVEDDEEDDDTDSGRTRVGDPPADADPEEIPDVEIKTIKHKWKIDNESPSINVRSKKVRVLITSNDLKKSCGDPAVAVTFPFGKGTVVHVLSHFGKQSSRQNEATIENFLVNFLIDVRVAVGNKP